MKNFTISPSNTPRPVLSELLNELIEAANSGKFAIETAAKKQKNYFCYAIYNPAKPTMSLEEAIETGEESNPAFMFSEKEGLEEKDLPKGFKLFKRIATIKND